MSRCERCSYWWQEDYENNPSCHYNGPEAWAPCAQEDGVSTDYDGNEVRTAEEAVRIMDAYLEASGNPYI